MVARSERSRIARASDSWVLSGHDRRPLSATPGAVLADAPVDAEQLAAAVTRHGTGWIAVDHPVDGERIRAWGDTLAGKAPAPETKDGFLDRERELTHLDRQFREQAAD
jgi:hypothetical protein